MVVDSIVEVIWFNYKKTRDFKSFYDIKINKECIIKSLKGLTFSGNDEDWSRWSKSFLISADVKGYRELLTGEV